MTRNLKWLMVLLVLAALVGIVNASTVYYLSDDNSALSSGVDFNKILNATTETVGTTGSISIAKGATEVSYAYTIAGIPNNADWTTGAATVKVNVTTAPASPYIALSMNLERINSAGTLQESATATAEQTINAAGVYTFSIASKDWTAGAATDRIRLKYSFRNIKTNGALTVTLATGQANSGVTTEIGVIPNAAFSANVTSGTSPVSVLFTDSSTYSPTTWAWYWYANETVSSTSQNPTTSFTSGVYNVRLYASNTNGGTWSNKTGYINVFDQVFSANTTLCKNAWNSSVTTFPNIRNGNGRDVIVDGVDPSLSASETTNLWANIQRGVCIFDTSNLPDTATITAASFYFTNLYKLNDFTPPPSFVVTGGSTVSNTTVSSSDYQLFTDTEYSNRLAYSDVPSAGNVVTFSFTTAGLNNISKTEFTKLFVRTSYDVDNSSPPWVNSGVTTFGNNLGIYYLGVIYTNTITTPISSFTTNVTNGTAPTSVLFTDTSTNTPTSWSWGAKNLTPGNNTWFQFSSATPPVTSSFGVGNWSLNLTATNSAGSNVSTQTTWLNVSAGAAVSPPVASFTVDKSVIRFPNIITCTDTSTNTPTSWEWKWGDGTANSTTQNPTHQYTKRGTYNIDMTATNAGGSGSATAKIVKVIGFQDNFT